VITTIIENASDADLLDAVRWVSDQLHVPASQVTSSVAVGYVVRHFEQGDYAGWEGFTEMRGADARSIARSKES